MELQKIKQRADRVLVCASGPSMPDLKYYADCCLAAGWYIIVVQDAWRVVPYADMLYGCDAKWWDHYGAEVVERFAGERWSSHDHGTNQKLETAEKFGLNLIRGYQNEGFSLDPKFIHYGSNSGFQAVNIALLMGAKEIALLGFDHRDVDGKRHFFGDHPNGWGMGEFQGWMREWELGRRSLPDGVQVYNCTPGSALKVFESRSPETLCEPSSSRPMPSRPIR